MPISNRVDPVLLLSNIILNRCHVDVFLGKDIILEPS